jgi:hypothetical protein
VFKVLQGMDLGEFDAQYPTPAHAAEAERRERVREPYRERFDYLLRCRSRSLSALASATKATDKAYIQETIAIADRMIAALERFTK